MLKPIDEFGMTERNGAPVVSSRYIAKRFNRRHDHLLEAIRDAVKTTEDFAPDFSGANFLESKYKDRGKWYPEILLTRDGFAFVVMGFTGKKAAKFKIDYINRFNEMEAFILSLQTAKLEHPAFTRAIMNAHEEPKHYHFSNEADMINRIVLGMPAKKYRELHDIPKGQSIRPYLLANEIYAIEELQRIDIGLITAVADFEKRKQMLVQQYQKLLDYKQLKGA